MKNFFKYIFLVLVGVGIIDISYRFVCDFFYMHPTDNSYVNKYYTFIHYDTPCQFVILGASTAEHSYIPQQIEDSLNVSAYNMGWAGRSVIYQYLSLLKALENGELKTVILNLSTSQMSDEWIEDRISELHPFYWRNDTIREIVKEIEGNYMEFLLCSGLIQFNSSLDNLLRTEKSKKGYIPLKYTGKPVTINERKNEITNYNPIAIKYLKKMKQTCKTNDIHLIVCLTPDLAITDNEQNALVSLCKRNDIEVWNMTDTVSDPLLFKDDHHLNEKGAEKFMSIFIEKYKREYGVAPFDMNL